MPHEDIYDALRACVSALGGAKKVGDRLWPEMGPQKAANRLNDCLNPSKRDVLNPEQLILILRRARAINCHAGIEYIAADCQYETPKPIEPEDEMMRLKRQFVQAVEELKVMQDRFDLMARLKVVGDD